MSTFILQYIHIFIKYFFQLKIGNANRNLSIAFEFIFGPINPENINIFRFKIKPDEIIYSSIDIRQKSGYLQPILYFLSQYTWLSFLILVFIIKNQPFYKTIPEIKGNQYSLKWNSSYDPHIFGLISDAHISLFRPESISHTKSILQILNDTGVEKILVAGDISDNFGSNASFKHGKQYESDFIEYQKITSQYQNDFIIVASGNHDEFGVEEYNSSNHYILKYCNFYQSNIIYNKYENFLISKVNYKDIEIFVMNPYHYPTVKAGVGYLMHLTTYMLDQIEKALSEKSNSTARLLITHFPIIFCNHHARSSTGKTLSEIISLSNLTSVISGHSHTYLVIHRNSSLELHSPSISPGRNSALKYGYVSIDNGYFSYQMFGLNEHRPIAVLTFPPEKKFLNKMTDFSQKKFNESEIRVVTFSEDANLNITVTCYQDSETDGYSGYLEFQRILRPNEALYSLPIQKVCHKIGSDDPLNFRLTFSGDWNYSAGFFSGETVSLGREMVEQDLNLYIGTFLIGFLMWLFVLFVWCPFISPPKICNDVNLWICGASMNSMVKYFGLLFGFLPIKSRISANISKRTRVFYFCVCLSPLFLPIAFMKIGKKSFGAILFFGYYLKGFVLDFWGLDLFALFVILVLVPSTIVFSAIAQLRQTAKWHFVFVFDAVMALAQVWLAVFAMGRFLYQSTSLLFVVTSPIFAFGSLFIFFLELAEICNYFK